MNDVDETPGHIAIEDTPAIGEVVYALCICGKFVVSDCTVQYMVCKVRLLSETSRRWRVLVCDARCHISAKFAEIWQHGQKKKLWSDQESDTKKIMREQSGNRLLHGSKGINLWYPPILVLTA